MSEEIKPIIDSDLSDIELDASPKAQALDIEAQAEVDKLKETETKQVEETKEVKDEKETKETEPKPEPDPEPEPDDKETKEPEAVATEKDTGTDTSDDIETETETDTETDDKKQVRDGPREREIKELKAQLKALNQRVEVQNKFLNSAKQAQPEVSQLDKYAAETKRKFEIYKNGLQQELESNGGNYVDTHGEKITKEQAVVELQNVTDYIKTLDTKVQTANPYQDDTLPFKSNYADQTQSQYVQRIGIADKFVEQGGSADMVEEFHPDFVSGFASLKHSDQDIVINGLARLMNTARTNADVMREYEGLKSYWQQSDPYSYVNKLYEFRDDCIEAFSPKAEKPKEAPVHKEAGKPTKGLPGGGSPKQTHKGALMYDDETEDEYMERREKELAEEYKLARGY